MNQEQGRVEKTEGTYPQGKPFTGNITITLDSFLVTGPGIPPKQDYPVQQAYPQAPGYQPGYPGQPQSGYYPGQPQPGYLQPQGYVPPPYTPSYTPQEQQVLGATNGAVVVTQQPVELPRSSLFGRTKNFYFTESTMLTLVLCVFGGWPALCCTVPAICLSLSAQKAHQTGNDAGAISKAMTAHRLIIAAMIYAVVGYIGYIVIVVIAAPVAYIIANAAVYSSS